MAVLGSALVTLTVRNFAIDQLDDRLYSFAGGDHHDATHTIDYYLGLTAAPEPDGHGHGDDDDCVLPTTSSYDDDDDAPATSCRPEHEDAHPFGEELPPSDSLRGVLSVEGVFTVVQRPTAYGAEALPLPVIDPARMPTDHDGYATVDSEGDMQYRVLAQPLEGGGWEITALSMESVEDTTRHLVLIEIGGVLALMIVLALVAWWVISLGIMPMRRMVATSSRIADGDLAVRLEERGLGREAGELASSLDRMITRLTDAVDERARSEARLRTFVADASHELRTPLTTVLGYAQLFRKGALEDGADQADAWTRTEAEASRMRRLVEDMLELARYDAEPQLHMASTDVAGLVREVLEDADRAHADCSFTFDSGPVRADVASPLHALVDADRLRQAVINVVNNAAQHGATHVSASVRVVTRGTGEGAADFVSIAVADDGPGMSPETAARVTERFVRGDASRARKTGGAGLGLAITAAIVDVHGGDLSIESTLGEGTTITITVPV